MAVGALRAIQAAGRGDEGLSVVGLDGESRATRAVASSKLAATSDASTAAPEGVTAARVLATRDMAALEAPGTVAVAEDGAVSVEIP